ncbi:13890_t:CDS:2 [Funneliformis geosporum]|uniref:6099_t:CDS:1 n=1 Tax=Funneliformis geosporum TaxID=1117311 RepID=A0A9W4WR15_9GLOM|nr:6099_t:CDS:2 [Funneliformis geosporum]CAI2179159.1 13890_t:CDS:2 [Funneliformis geosporum]
MVYLFDVPAYFILLRETLEVTIILAVLLGIIDKLVPKEQELRKHLKRQIWIGTGAGLIISLIIAAVFIIIFYTVAKNLWEENEAAWEGSFALVASVVITIMALSMVRIQQWKNKWEGKLANAAEEYLNRHKNGNKWALILLPFTAVCRESLETLVFIAGVGLDKPASGLPIPVILGMATGFLIGYLIYKGSHKMSLKIFFIFSTVLLLFIAAGLFSTSVHELQEVTGTEEKVLWQLKCCNPKTNEFWAILKVVFGWRNKATQGTTAAYFVYWAVVSIAIAFIWYRGKKESKGEEFSSKDVDDNTDKLKVDV